MGPECAHKSSAREHSTMRAQDGAADATRGKAAELSRAALALAGASHHSMDCRRYTGARAVAFREARWTSALSV